MNLEKFTYIYFLKFTFPKITLYSYCNIKKLRDVSKTFNLNITYPLP